MITAILGSLSSVDEDIFVVLMDEAKWSLSSIGEGIFVVSMDEAKYYKK